MVAAARAGAPKQARDLLERADSLAAGYSPPPLHTAVWLAEAWAALGDADRAVGWLHRYGPSADLHFQLHLRCDPPFAAVENDARFRALLLRGRPKEGC